MCLTFHSSAPTFYFQTFAIVIFDETLFQKAALGVAGSTHLVLFCFFKERFVIHITDLLAVSMMLGITAQVKEAGIAWDKGEKKSKQNNLGSL